MLSYFGRSPELITQLLYISLLDPALTEEDLLALSPPSHAAV